MVAERTKRNAPKASVRSSADPLDVAIALIANA
jgi:hypothetical protein